MVIKNVKIAYWFTYTDSEREMIRFTNAGSIEQLRGVESIH